MTEERESNCEKRRNPLREKKPSPRVSKCGKEKRCRKRGIGERSSGKALPLRKVSRKKKGATSPQGGKKK